MAARRTMPPRPEPTGVRALRWAVRIFTGLLAAVLVALVGSLAALAAIGHALRVEDPLAPADVIVAVSGDTGPRVETAARLWRDQYAPLVVFSGASQDPESAPSAELMRREAVRLGVPAEAVLVEGDSFTTEQNAERVAELMAARNLHTAILVTSPYHQRRAAMFFERAFAKRGLQFRNYPARDPAWDPNLWWTRDDSRNLTLVELAKLGVVITGSAERTAAPSTTPTGTRSSPHPSPTGR